MSDARLPIEATRDELQWLADHPDDEHARSLLVKLGDSHRQEVAAQLARAVFSVCNRPGFETTRIEYKIREDGIGPEKVDGGLCEDALAGVLARALRDIEMNRPAPCGRATTQQ